MMVYVWVYKRHLGAMWLYIYTQTAHILHQAQEWWLHMLPWQQETLIVTGK